MHKIATSKKYPKRARAEATRELEYYRQEGVRILQERKGSMAKKKRTPEPEVDESADHETRVYSGRGVLFAVADDREKLGEGSTISVIAAAIEDALDNGHDDAESIARWITTSSFGYEPDKRVRYNSMLRAGDAVGAQLTRKLYNAYNDLAELAATAETEADKKLARVEASGFAAALSIVFSPFSCEDEGDHRLVDWDMVDHITGLFETEQRAVRRERKGNPQ